MAKTIPKSETLWLTATNRNGNTFLITSTKDRSKYILYSKSESGVEKIATSSTPVKLTDKIDSM